MSITIYGASDDLIEIDGDISEEFTYADNNLLAFSDGTILRIEYGYSGVWRISPVVRGAASLAIEQAPEGDDDNYSDRATLDGAVWVVYGSHYATAVSAVTR